MSVRCLRGAVCFLGGSPFFVCIYRDIPLEPLNFVDQLSLSLFQFLAIVHGSLRLPPASLFLWHLKQNSKQWHLEVRGGGWFGMGVGSIGMDGDERGRRGRR